MMHESVLPSSDVSPSAGVVEITLDGVGKLFLIKLNILLDHPVGNYDERKWQLPNPLVAQILNFASLDRFC